MNSLTNLSVKLSFSVLLIIYWDITRVSEYLQNFAHVYFFDLLNRTRTELSIPKTFLVICISFLHVNYFKNK